MFKVSISARSLAGPGFTVNTANVANTVNATFRRLVNHAGKKLDFRGRLLIVKLKIKCLSC